MPIVRWSGGEGIWSGSRTPTGVPGGRVPSRGRGLIAPLPLNGSEEGSE